MLTITKQFLFLMKVINCVHIEHEHYEEVEKYYQYGYQVDDHYTGQNTFIIYLLLIFTFRKNGCKALALKFLIQEFFIYIGAFDKEVMWAFCLTKKLGSRVTK